MQLILNFIYFVGLNALLYSRGVYYSKYLSWKLAVDQLKSNSKIKRRRGWGEFVLERKVESRSSLGLGDVSSRHFNSAQGDMFGDIVQSQYQFPGVAQGQVNRGKKLRVCPSPLPPPWRMALAT